MKNFKTSLLIMLFLSAFINPIKAQEEEAGTDLSFLMGQKNIKLEFSYEGLTIDDQPEAAFLNEAVAKMNEKNPGSGDELSAYWKTQKKTEMPRMFTAGLNNNLSSYHFRADTLEAKPKQKYVCVIRLISINPGRKMLTSPTLWVSCTFYEEGNRNKPLASFKYHLDYAKGGNEKTGHGRSTYMGTGSWDECAMPYFTAGKRLAGKVKKMVN